MKNKYFIIFALGVILIVFGCSKSISITMISLNENDDCSLTWGYAFPNNYFKYIPKTELFLTTNEQNIEQIKINTVVVRVNELNYEETFKDESKLKISKEDNRFDIKLYDCFNSIMKTEKDMEKFKNIKNVEVIIEYEKKGVNDNWLFNFKPKVSKSCRIWDNMMSI